MIAMTDDFDQTAPVPAALALALAYVLADLEAITTEVVA